MGAATYKLAVRCVCGSRARIDAEGELVEHKTPQGTRCYDRVKEVDPPRRRVADICANCSLYVCVCSLLAMCWPILLTLALFASGCVVGPDGRRVLSPEARAAGQAVAEDIIACGGTLALVAAFGALAGEAPTAEDYRRAGECHFRRAAVRFGVLELAKLNTQADAAERELIEHGRAVAKAIKVRERDDGEVLFGVDEKLAGECEATARARLAGEVQP